MPTPRGTKLRSFPVTKPAPLPSRSRPTKPPAKVLSSRKAAALGSGGGKGTRAVASYDEDTTSMGVEAARIALEGVPDRRAVQRLLFATAHPSYADKTNATAIFAAQNLRAQVLMTAFLSLLIFTSVFAIAEINYPFTGPSHVESHALGEVLEAARLDLDWHSLPATAPRQDVDAFEAKALATGGFDTRDVPPRYRSSYFLHIWSNGYSAGYYAYPWTRMLAEDAFDWFENHGGLTRANGQRFRDLVLSRGNTLDYGQMYRSFTGHDPDVTPMLRFYGLPTNGAPQPVAVVPAVPLAPAGAHAAPKKGERG